MLLRGLKRDEGATAVEYAVLLALIALVCLKSVGKIGTNANKSLKQVATAVKVKK